MLRRLALFTILALVPLSAHALDAKENAKLLREYAQVAQEINDGLEGLSARLLSSRERQQILLGGKKRVEFCAEVKGLFSALSHKMHLLEPGVLTASDTFHDKANEATTVQMEKFRALTFEYPAAFKVCEARGPKPPPQAPSTTQ